MSLPRYGRGASRGARVAVDGDGGFHERAQDVDEQHVHLLDPLRVAGRHDHGGVRHIRHPPSVTPQQRQSRDASAAASGEGTDEVLRITAGAEAYEHVAALGEPFELPREDIFETDIVGPCREDRGVGREGHHRQRRRPSRRNRPISSAARC